MSQFQDEHSPLYLATAKALQDQQFSRRVEQKYLYWVNKFLYFHKERHPKTMHEAQVQDFLTHLALRMEASSSSQNIALKAISFMFLHVLDKPVVESKISLPAKKEAIKQNIAA